jgi:hypothetical protein
MLVSYLSSCKFHIFAGPEQRVVVNQLLFVVIDIAQIKLTVVPCTLQKSNTGNMRQLVVVFVALSLLAFVLGVKVLNVQHRPAPTKPTAAPKIEVTRRPATTGNSTTAPKTASAGPNKTVVLLQTAVVTGLPAIPTSNISSVANVTIHGYAANVNRSIELINWLVSVQRAEETTLAAARDAAKKVVDDLNYDMLVLKNQLPAIDQEQALLQMIKNDTATLTDADSENDLMAVLNQLDVTVKEDYKNLLLKISASQAKLDDANKDYATKQAAYLLDYAGRMARLDAADSAIAMANMIESQREEAAATLPVLQAQLKK